MAAKELPNFAQKLLDRIKIENGFSDCSVQVKQGSQTGDGFSSEMFSITIAEHKSDKKLYLLCKVAPFNEHHRRVFLSELMFNNEESFYRKITSLFVEFQVEKNVPKEDQFLTYPKCYAAVADEDNKQYAIILEDLRPQGFKMWNKAKPSPIENVRLAMQELGKLHGLSFAMRDQKPAEFTKIKKMKNVFKILPQSATIVAMFEVSFDRAIKSLKCEEHKDIMRDVKTNLIAHIDRCEDVVDEFGVLCHGDYWNNNMLFRFNRNDIAEDIRILDWQMIRYVSPAIDILYNLFTSTDKALRDKEYENLLNLYHKSLSRTVQLLGSNPDELFTFENLKDELKRCGNYMLLLVPILLGVSVADSSQVSDMDEMFESAVEGGSKPDLITGLNDDAQLEFDRRINEVFEDVVRLGYYRKLNTN